MHTCYFIIEPEFLDPDAFAKLTVANPNARISISMFLDLERLTALVHHLRSEASAVRLWPDDFSLVKEGLHVGFEVLLFPAGKILRTTIVNDEAANAYRGQVDIRLVKEEPGELADELERWVQSPQSFLLWKK